MAVSPGGGAHDNAKWVFEFLRFRHIVKSGVGSEVHFALSIGGLMIIQGIIHRGGGFMTILKKKEVIFKGRKRHFFSVFLPWHISGLLP